MEDTLHDSPVANLLKNSKSVVIVLPPDPSEDMVSAGISLHLALQNADKKSQIGCGSEIHVNPRIQGAREISDTIGSRNLIISFDYDENNLEKVDYDVKSDGRFYLMVKPKPDAPVPEVNNVKFSYSGADAELVIVFGINNLEELGKIYAEEKAFLDEAKILSLNISPQPAGFTANLYHHSSGSFCELVSDLLEKVGVSLPLPAASNLLNSIYESTNKLTSARITPNTFSSLAYLMRSGAKLPNQQSYVPKFSQPPFFEIPQPEESSDSSPESSQPVPTDWKQPKIFRATDL